MTFDRATIKIMIIRRMTHPSGKIKLARITLCRIALGKMALCITTIKKMRCHTKCSI
jgi:hypothetical protein